MEVAEQKIELRKLITLWKGEFPEDLKRQQEQSVYAILERMPQFVASKRVAIYWSLRSEFSTRDFIAKWASEKEFYLPKVVESDLVFCKFEGVESLEKCCSFGVMESLGTQTEIADLDLMIVPGEAYTQRGERLGKGGGYYDRALRERKCYTLALCYDFQVVDELPLELHDEKVDLVLYYRGF